MKTKAGEDKEGRIVEICADNDQLFVLCEDGTMWTLDTLEVGSESEWRRIPELPE